MADEPDNDAVDDEDLDAILAATARDRRTDGLKMLGGGVGALVLAGVMHWFVGGEGGEVSRILTLILTYGSLFLGVLLTLFGATLVANSYLVEP